MCSSLSLHVSKLNLKAIIMKHCNMFNKYHTIHPYKKQTKLAEKHHWSINKRNPCRLLAPFCLLSTLLHHLLHRYFVIVANMRCTRALGGEGNSWSRFIVFVFIIIFFFFHFHNYFYFCRFHRDIFQSFLITCVFDLHMLRVSFQEKPTEDINISNT